PTDGPLTPPTTVHSQPRHLPPRGPPTPYVIEFPDRLNRPLQARRVLLTDPHTDLDSAELNVTEQLPMTDEVASVVFLCQDGDCSGRILQTINVLPLVPNVTIDPVPDTSGEIVRVS